MTSRTDTFIGQMAPDFSLTDTNGRSVSLKEYRGRPVLLVFNRGFV